jgi:tetratricopeptide (TPR) repeat protein
LAAAASPEDGEYRIVVQVSTPLAVECYKNARDELTGPDAAAPCTRSLENESLGQRQQAAVYANRGVIYYNSGAYEEAISDFTASLDLNIFVRARILTNRGLAYEALRYDALARADYRQALILNQHEDRARTRLQELDKPFIERSKLPHRISVEAPRPPEFSS